IALIAGQPEEALLEDRISPVPQRDGEADLLMPVANSGQAIFVPAIRLRPRMIVREVLPGGPAVAVVLAHCAPGALAEVRSPSFPVRFPAARFFESLLFRCHARVKAEQARNIPGLLGKGGIG